MNVITIDSQQNKQLLISAYGCEPNKGSEQGVGWHWVLELAKTHEVWVITRSNNREAITSAPKFKKNLRIHFIYYDLPETIKKIKQNDKGLYPYYFFWQLGAYRLAKKLLSKLDFDYCIALTFGSMWMPTFFYKLPIPFIWGPVGGGESVPFRFIKVLPWKARIPQFARYLLIYTVSCNPFFMGPCRAAKAIIARTEDSRQVFPNKYRSKVSVMLETGMSREVFKRFSPASVTRKGQNINLIYVGRLVDQKYIDSAILALAIVRKVHKNVRLTIVGDGPSKPRLLSLVRELGVNDSTVFTGSVSQREAILALQESNIFLFPSLKEGGTWSLMEAMAIGLPTICLDTTGMSVITDNSCAIRIPPTNPEEVIPQIAEAIIKLVDSPEMRKTMGENARSRIQTNYLWSQKGEFMLKLFEKLDKKII